MAYFNHAFVKTFLATSVLDANGTATKDLNAGQISIVDSGDWQSLANGSISAATGLLHVVQGSFRSSDKLGNNPGHGGYKESIKSKGINTKYITKIWGAEVASAAAATSTVSVGAKCAPCGENLFIRLDIKGSPALRFLNHNAYAIGDSSGDSDVNGASIPSLCCADGQEFLDPAVALAAAAQMVIADPVIKPFVAEGSSGNVATLTVSAGGSGYTSAAAVVTSGGSGSGLKVDTTVAAGAIASAVINANNGGKGYKVGDIVDVAGGTGGKLAVATVAAGGVIVETTAVPFTSHTIAQILDGSSYTASADPVADGVSASVSFVGAYVDTQFGTCSFDTRDHYEKEPVQIIASILDETGDPCNDCGVVTSTPGTMAQTLGHKVRQDLLLADAYMQNPYNQGNADSARIREIEGSKEIIDSVTSATALYKAYYLQHSVPRFNNPTGVFDNDQYLYVIYVPNGGPTAALETLLTAISTAAGLGTPDYDVEN
jgi:hypothetical protein